MQEKPFIPSLSFFVFHGQIKPGRQNLARFESELPLGHPLRNRLASRSRKFVDIENDESPRSKTRSDVTCHIVFIVSALCGRCKGV